MKKSRFTQEQIIGFIKQAETGMPMKELWRKREYRIRQNVRIMTTTGSVFGKQFDYPWCARISDNG